MSRRCYAAHLAYQVHKSGRKTSIIIIIIIIMVGVTVKTVAHRASRGQSKRLFYLLTLKLQTLIEQEGQRLSPCIFAGLL